ncbi:MAG: glycosyltransferase family 2 protein [Candidatus Omnitrophica bacterium]|nr:glycosyltransferase family 2 protein [Candidatus Omnitrophota bacterium]
MKSKMNICVIVPTYNEAENIAHIIKKLKNYDLEVVVIDDGSYDDTSKIAEACGAKVIKNLKNEGKGAALKKGFDYVLKNNFDAVITMDGDGQHLPEDIPKFIKRAEESNASIFIGNRMYDLKNMPLTRKITNLAMSAFISFIVKQYIPDTQCGFRLIKKEILERFKFTTQRYETESEILIKTAKAKYRIESLPINCVYRKYKKSQINPLMDTLRFIWFIIRHYIKH